MMSAAIDLLKIEKKAYRDSRQDGLMEVILVGPFVHAQSRSGNVRYTGYAILSVVLGLLFSLAEFASGRTGLILYLVLMGGFLFISGLFIFARFLRRYPLATTGGA